MKTQSLDRIDVLSPFARAYVEAALWSSTTGEEGTPLDREHDAWDIDPASLAKMAADCARFESENETSLAAYYETIDRNGHPDSPQAFAGHDFWLTRNGHGTGFWDRSGISPALGESLSNAARAFGESYLYLGDSGAVYCD